MADLDDALLSIQIISVLYGDSIVIAILLETFEQPIKGEYEVVIIFAID